MCFDRNLNSYFQKKYVLTQTKIQPKLLKGNLKSTIPKQIFKNKNKKKSSTLIRIIRKNKIPPKEECVYIYIYIYRERERERVLTVILCKKYGLNKRNDIEFIQNKIGRRRVKI